MKIYLVRHGETDWNQAGLLQGQTDIALNAQGLEQAHEAAERLKEVPFEIAFCSPLIRAKRTAEIIHGNIQNGIQYTAVHSSVSHHQHSLICTF